MYICICIYVYVYIYIYVYVYICIYIYIYIYILVLGIQIYCLFPVETLQEGTRPYVLGGRGRVWSCFIYVFTKGT